MKLNGVGTGRIPTLVGDIGAIAGPTPAAPPAYLAIPKRAVAVTKWALFPYLFP